MIAVVAAFVVGASMTFILQENTVDAEKPESSSETFPREIVLTPAGSGDGFLFPPTIGMLYFGDELCGVQAATGIHLYLEFATPTLVKHDDATCPEHGTGSVEFLLSGGQDVQFQIGDILVLQRDCENCATPFEEVYSEQTP